MAAVDLQQHPLAGHPLTSGTVLGGSAAAGLSMPARAGIRRTVLLLHVQALVLPEQLGEVGVVRPR